MTQVSAVPILVEWERFIAENPQGGTREFANWLLVNTDPLRKTPVQSESGPLLKSGMRLSEAFREGRDFLAWFFMGRLIRYVRFYTKQLMSAHGLSGPDEFLLLSLINEMNQPTRKEVCVANATELTTGLDMLRRLGKLGLVEEFPDERDGRSKRLLLTEKGQQTVQQVGVGLSELQPSMLADLGDAERKVFLQTLQYLNNYHFLFYKP
jgi:DNA-binding MarR family transcriptional regulator